MTICSVSNVRIRGITTCVPKQSVSNLDCPPEQKGERERLIRNIGIQNRRVSRGNQCFSDLAQDAAEHLIEGLHWKREEIDALIVITQSPDYSYPGTAILIQDRMKLPTTCLAFDINLGCSGYPYGLFVMASMMSAGKIKKALVLVGDKSTNTESQDTGFVVLFSDAGTATALEYDDAAPPMYFDMNSDGSGYQAIYCPAGGNRVPLTPEHMERRLDDNGIMRRGIDIVLDGPAILNFSLLRVPPATRMITEYAGLTFDDIDYFVYHQANRMINETIRKKLGIPPEKVPVSLWDYGNTSSASIPLTLTVNTAESLMKERKRVLMCGFGVGLSWATCIAELDHIYCPPLIEQA